MSLGRVQSIVHPIFLQLVYRKRIVSTFRNNSSVMNPNTKAIADCLLQPIKNSEYNYQRRLALAKAITLVESSLPSHIRQAELLLKFLHGFSQHSVKGENVNGSTDQMPSFRIGITGSPGVGKSSFIDTLGKFVIEQTALSIATLCVDPSSTISGGSILGDKSRMPYLSSNHRAFVRPSPSKGTLGGLSTYTNDAVTLCEAAGYNLILVESVGVGQSEIEIAQCVDMTILLIPPGGGDSLQGMKKGIVEIVDLILINKADGDLFSLACQTASEYDGALHQNARMSPFHDDGSPSVLVVSSKSMHGISNVWDNICKRREIMSMSGELNRKRQENLTYWMWRHLKDLIETSTSSNKDLQKRFAKIREDLYAGKLSSRAAARELFDQILILKGGAKT